MKRKPQPDRFDVAEETARAHEAAAQASREPRKAKPQARKAKAASKPAAGKAKAQATRKPNADYERDGRLFAILPVDLCDDLDAAVIAERRKRRPAIVDKSMIVEEALRDWLKKYGR